MAWQVKSLKDAYRPVLWLNCIFCMGIFEIPMNQPRPFLTLIYIILIVIGYFAILYKALKQYITHYQNDMLISLLVAGINISSAIFSVILFWYNTKFGQNINIIIKQLNIADDTLRVLGVEKNYRKIFYKVLIYVISWILFLILLQVIPTLGLGLYKFDYIELICVYISFGFTIALNTLVDLTICSFLRYLKINFHNMNDLMNDMLFFINEAGTFRNRIRRKNKLMTILSRNNYGNNKERIKHLMQILKQLHLELTKTGLTLNNIYYMQILLELAVHFTIITTAAYNMYFYIISKSFNYRMFIETILWIIWGFVYSLKIILFNNLCSITSNEANKAAEIVQSFDGCLLDKELQEEIHQFTQQIVLRPLHFTASGFITLNNALTDKFFATVMTYVVILIQFRTSSECNEVSRCPC